MLWEFYMKKFFNILLSLIYPDKCIFCRKITDMGKGIYICDDCKEKLVFCENALCCKMCGKPQVSLGDKELCYNCRTRTYRTYKKAAAVVKYDKLSSFGIKRYKDGNNYCAGNVFAKLMSERLKSQFSGIEFDFIVGVPATRQRTVKRGMDPVDILCENLSGYTEIPYIRGALKRIKNIPKQSSLSYSKRMKNIIGAIGIRNADKINGKVVLLVDDVMTTGATVDECTYILKTNGAKAVYVLTFATTVKEPKSYKNCRDISED